MILRELLPRLSGVRKGWQGYAAKCPAHEDRVQSLSLTETNGRILFKCHAGCTTKEIVESLSLQWKDIFDDRIIEPSRATMSKQRT